MVYERILRDTLELIYYTQHHIVIIPRLYAYVKAQNVAGAVQPLGFNTILSEKIADTLQNLITKTGRDL